MTEYDLAKKQLVEVLQATVRAASREHWTLVLGYAEDIKLLTQHLQLLHNAPRASDVP